MRFQDPALTLDAAPPVRRLLERLDRVSASGNGKWRARCPAHDDRAPSAERHGEVQRRRLGPLPCGLPSG